MGSGTDSQWMIPLARRNAVVSGVLARLLKHSTPTYMWDFETWMESQGRVAILGVTTTLEIQCLTMFVVLPGSDPWRTLSVVAQKHRRFSRFDYSSTMTATSTTCATAQRGRVATSLRRVFDPLRLGVLRRATSEASRHTLSLVFSKHGSIWRRTVLLTFSCVGRLP